MREKLAKTEHLKKRLFQIVEVGYTQDRVSRLYDIVNVAAIIINLIVSILYTFDPMEERYGGAIVAIDRTLPAQTLAALEGVSRVIHDYTDLEMLLRL